MDQWAGGKEEVLVLRSTNIVYSIYTIVYST